MGIVPQVLGHEFTHRLKQLSADDYARLEAFALSHSQTADEVRARYASLNLSEQDMAEEITAAYAEMLFSDEQTARRIANEDRGLARRILDFIKDLIGRIRGKVPSELTQAERLWRNALHSAEGRVQQLSRNAGKESGAATKNTAGKDGGKFSIAYTTENEPVVVIEEDILAGVSKSNYAKVVRQAMRKFDRGIPVGGRLIKVNAITRNEFTRSRNTQFYKGDNEVIYRDKMKAGGYLDEIVLASTNYINEGLNHARKDSFKEFARGNVYMKIGENSYSAKVIIGFTGNEMVLYDIVDIQPVNFNTKKDSTKANSQKGDTFEQVESLSEPALNLGTQLPDISSSLSERFSASVNTISQSEDNVNTHDMQISEKYSLDAMDKTEALLEQYGALPEGEREGSAAGREVRVPRRTAKENRTRRTVRTVMEAAVTSDEIAGDLKEKIEAGEFSYLPTSNKTLLDNAETLVKEKGFDAVLSEWRAHVESTREANDRMLGVGEYLLIHALKTKDANLAGTLAVELSVEATAAGRSVSAVRMIKRLGPAAKVYEVMRTVEKLSETTIERRGSRKAVEEYLRGLSLRAAQKKALWGTLYDSESPWGKGTAFAVPFFVV